MFNVFRHRRITFALAGLTGLLSTGGCQFAPEHSLWPASWMGKEQTVGLPDRVTPFWTDTVLHQPAQPGVRGFGGRVYFYKDGQEDPIDVDGGLVVYAFDNDADPSQIGKPIKKFVFTADQFATHMSRTHIGPSYSIWLPWDEVGGPTKQLSLVTRFEGRAGGVVISQPAVKLLPGVNKFAGNVQQQTDLSPPAVIQPASFVGGDSSNVVQSVATDGPKPQAKNEVPTRATTIDLPPSFQRHLRSGQQPETQPAPHQQTAPLDQPRLNTGGSGDSGGMGIVEPSKPEDGIDASVPGQVDASVPGRAASPVLRNTFRRSATAKGPDATKTGVLGGRPASWLVAPR